MKSPRSMLLAGLYAVGGLCVVVYVAGVIHIGSEIVAEQVRHKLETEPKFVEPVGQVQEFATEFLATIVQPDDVRVYRVKGTKWSGRVKVKQVTDYDGNEQIIWARFKLPSGETVEINAP
jgi:hypothetical protein